MNEERNNSFPKNFLKKIILRKTSISKNFNIPLISVVMPSFNKVNYIEKSILSVVNQNYQNIELIIIDGGSEDGTVETIKKYNKFISYWVSEKDNGQSNALNKGFKLCTGEIFCWLNSDDLFLPGTFKTVAEILLNNKEKKICFGDWLSINANDEIIDMHYAFDMSINHLKYEGFHLNAQSLFWLREVHESFSGFDIKLNKTMDYQMMLEFAIKQSENAFLRIDKTLAAFRRYEGQKTAGYNFEEDSEHKYLSVKYNYQDKYLTIGKIKRLMYRFRRARWYFIRGGTKEFLKRLINL